MLRYLGVAIRFMIFAPVFPLLVTGTMVTAVSSGRWGGTRQMREVAIAGERLIRRGWWWVKGGISLPFETIVEFVLIEEPEPISAEELSATLRDHPYPENTPARVEKILESLVASGRAISLSGKYSSTADQLPPRKR